ncbi:MAG: toll/interleukin-1 receptor domain-containing protein [Gammaproteobacteria bacterium]
MAGIFISYRRNDTSGYSRLLYERLGREFGSDEIFMDVESLREPGMDFVDAINDGVGRCSVLICLIGRQWLQTGTDGNRRIDNPEDFVRLEIGSALQRNVRVIPVVVEGAAIPTAEDLPQDLQALARRQALNLSHEDWEYDVGKLVSALSNIDGIALVRDARNSTPPPAPKAERSGSPLRTGMISVLAIIGVLAVIGMFIEEEDTVDPVAVEAANAWSDDGNVATTANIAGRWFDNNGEPVLIEQSGNSIRVGAFNAMTQGFMQIGEGTVSGRQLALRYSNPMENMSGTVTATIDPDQQHMNGEYTVEQTGLTMADTWHREHLPSH